MAIPRLGTRFDRRVRAALRVAFVLAASAFLSGHARAEPAHGLSQFGDLKYPADFPHFDYVNADAPKGGRLAHVGTSSLLTFDSFNGYIVRGNPAQGLGYTSEILLIFDSLMTRAHDEPDAVYGLVARAAEQSADRQTLTFYLRPEARFADGSALTASDVKFSIDMLRQYGRPAWRAPFLAIGDIAVVDPHTIRFQLKPPVSRDLALIIAVAPIFSEAYYTALAPKIGAKTSADIQGECDRALAQPAGAGTFSDRAACESTMALEHVFNKTTLEPPLGSGPYAIDRFEAGRFVSYKRRADYWGWNLPVNRGRYNFDEIRYEYYRDRTAQLQGLLADEYDLREEFTSRDWATAYDVPAIKAGHLIKDDTLKDARPAGTQGFFLNTRRPHLSDARVRRALDLAFDFEWTNKTLFYDLYERTNSFFENSDHEASGPPTAEELALLEPHRANLPEAVFGPAYEPPVSDGSGRPRQGLNHANRLLTEAGWTLNAAGQRVNAKGEVLSLEFLNDSPVFERIMLPYANNLKLLGIEAKIRSVDAAQYLERVRVFDFDIVSKRYAMAPTPGRYVETYFGSASADQPSSDNLAGIKHPVVDALIAAITNAETRDEARIAARALDRVLRAGHYWVPHWSKTVHHLVYWNRFSRPAIKPLYQRGVVETWWFDAAKAATIPGAAAAKP